jgi:TonB family protein
MKTFDLANQGVCLRRLAAAAGRQPFMLSLLLSVLCHAGVLAVLLWHGRRQRPPTVRLDRGISVRLTMSRPGARRRSASSSKPSPRSPTGSQTDEAAAGPETSDDDAATDRSRDGAPARGAVAQTAGQHNPAPVYPPLAKKWGWEGTVRLSLRVRPDGRVDTVTVITSSGHDILDQAARRGVRRWRFAPRRASVQKTIAIRFRIDDT